MEKKDMLMIKEKFTETKREIEEKVGLKTLLKLNELEDLFKELYDWVGENT